MLIFENQLWTSNTKWNLTDSLMTMFREYSRTKEESASLKAWNSLREKALVIANLHNLVHDENDIDNNYVRM